MNLTIKDRVLILKCLLPIYDSRRGIELKNSISEKIYLSDSEEKQVVLTNVGNDQIEVSFKSVEAITQERNFELSEEELKYLKQRIDFLDQDGRFSDYTLDTYSKIADEPLPNTEDTSHVEEQQTDME